ncbi:immunoglobulin domain-containing protein [Runella sp.]|uniref:immunoglobulin domain-containing protein n=1 Tax=Runella sp. TaxID=1960881 RepID=UPI003D0B8DA1
MKKALSALHIFLLFLSYSGYGQDNNRYLAMLVLNIQEDNLYESYANMVPAAKAMGCNSVYIAVRWDITKCPSFQCISDPNVASEWRPVDNVINKALQSGIQKIALRIHLGANNAYGINRSGFIWGGEANEARDMAGNVYTDGYNDKMFSLAHQPSVEKAKNFVTEVTQRYKYLQDQGKLLFISVSITSNQEGEYPHWGIFDYSSYMKESYSNWHLAQYGSTALPPSNLNNEAGKRWYTFRHLKLKEFLDQMGSAVKAVDSNIKFVLDMGSVYDGASKNRGTLGFEKLSCRADGVKINDDISYNHRFSMDLLRTNAPNKWIMNELFPQGSTSEKVNFLKESYQHGAKLVSLVIGSQGSIDEFAPAVQSPEVQQYLTTPMSPITTTTTTTYLLSNILNNSGFNLSGYSQPQKIILNDDVLPQCSPNTCNFNLGIMNSNPNPSCGDAITLTANCTGGNCDGVSYTWTGKGISSSGNFLNISVPKAKGNYMYTLSASKSGCDSKVSTGIIVKECEGNELCAVNRVRLKFRKDCCLNHLAGAQIQGSTNGVTWDSLYTVSQNATGTWQEFNFNNLALYPQIRFVSGSTANGELLEIEFYQGAKKLYGTLFGTGGNYANAMDGDETTLWTGQTAGKTNFIGLVLKGCGDGS